MKGAAVIVVINSVIQWLLHVTYEEPWNPPPVCQEFPKDPRYLWGREVFLGWDNGPVTI